LFFIYTKKKNTGHKYILKVWPISYSDKSI